MTAETSTATPSRGESAQNPEGAKRKLDEESAGNKKARAEVEPRGVMRYHDEWEQMANRLKKCAEKRAAERNNHGGGMSTDMLGALAALKKEQEEACEEKEEVLTKHVPRSALAKRMNNAEICMRSGRHALSLPLWR